MESNKSKDMYYICYNFRFKFEIQLMTRKKDHHLMILDCLIYIRSCRCPGWNHYGVAFMLEQCVCYRPLVKPRFYTAG